MVVFPCLTDCVQNKNGRENPGRFADQIRKSLGP